MCIPILAHMCACSWLLTFYITCVWLSRVAGMTTSATPQTCEEIACENNNICQSTFSNGTLTDHAYCMCRGQWAGLRCEARLHLSVTSTSTHEATIEMHGVSSNQHFSLRELYVTEVTVALWNLNMTSQCLLLLNDEIKDYVILKGLTKGQEYIVCVGNGQVDSCSFFDQGLTNISTVTNCIGFETKSVNELFDIGLIIVPCAVVVFLIIIVIFLYYYRHSVILQLILNIFCCRSCYPCRRLVKRKRRLMRRQREISGDVLMPPDLPIDFETESDLHTASFEELVYGRTKSSNASSSGSRKSAYSVEMDSSVPIMTAVDHNAFLYEDQSLITPIYSPQDHKIMTLTYIEDDMFPIQSQHSGSNYVDPLYPGGIPQSLPPATPYGSHVTDLDPYPPRQHPNNISYWSSLPSSGFSTQNYTHSNSNHQTASVFNQLKKRGFPDHIGPVRQQFSSNHSHQHRPYDRWQPYSTHSHSRSPSNTSSKVDYEVKFRHLNHSTRPRPRPNSLPYTLMSSEPPKTTHLRNFDWYANIDFTYPYYTSFLHTNGLPPGSSEPSQQSAYSKDHIGTSTFTHSPQQINHLLSTPTLYKSILKDERSVTPVFQYHSDYDTNESNTLPRSKRPRFLLPENPFEGLEEASPSTLPRVKKPLLALKRPQRPTKLELPTPGHPVSTRKRFYPTSQLTAASSSTPVESKPQSRHVRNLISHFEHSFLRSSKSNRATDEEEEFRDLQSPLAEERGKNSKKRRKSSLGKSAGRDTPTPTPPNDLSRLNILTGNPIFDGHPSAHTIPPFSTDDEAEDETKTSILSLSTTDDTDKHDDSMSITTPSNHSIISSYDDDDTNLVTPFCTEDSSDDDDDTYHDVKSLTASIETLQNDALEIEELCLENGDVESETPSTSQRSKDSNDHSEESDKLLTNSGDS